MSAEPIQLPDPPTFGRERMADGVTEYLRELIMSGALRAGDRLRVEHLAAQFKLSVTPVRESLIELFNQGFVEREPRRGYVVAKLTRQGFLDQVLILAMVTGELAARAAERVEAMQLTTLRSLQRALDHAVETHDHDGAEIANYRLHREINLLADSPTFARYAQGASHYIPRFTWQSLASRPTACSYEHADILSAIEAHDSAAARAAMMEHMTSSGARLADELGRAGLWD
ncbi:GntR family transcriptional regulator [Pseudonocardia kujensis]|uniref:GntR family transcriptional regulator n=1 Tax=Pseudonocardia kujensis TaxID=1128675 RepID=UPI001E3A71C6|nr:GntR family transcriptional regulator [Pseudonocardia kujensis]MCE0762098.1 GntR family transcriptional regulator [Pseudonocardia kujensis]